MDHETTTSPFPSTMLPIETFRTRIGPSNPDPKFVVKKVNIGPVNIGDETCTMDKRTAQRIVSNFPQWKETFSDTNRKDLSGIALPSAGCTFVSSYKKFYVGKKRLTARKAIYALFFGDVPTGSRIAHVIPSSDGDSISEVPDPECVNPLHLACVCTLRTQKEGKREKYLELIERGIDKKTAREISGVSSSWADRCLAEKIHNTEQDQKYTDFFTLGEELT
jgi:hypothetical protein